MAKKCTVYTRQGDNGLTSLISQERVSKSDLRIEAYGLLDELNAYIGWMLSAFPNTNQCTQILKLGYQIQESLFNIGASFLSYPSTKVANLTEKDIESLELSMNRLNETLPPLKTFILPGGGECASRAHLTRTFCRRLERHLVHLNKQPDMSIPVIILAYINRLSDWFFIVARFISVELQEPERCWHPKPNLANA